jgi:hypothetical protein
MMDTLSDVLRAVRLTGAVFFSVEASAPWVAEAPAGSTVGPEVLPEAEHVIAYHVVTAGTCWGGLIDEPALKLQAGDIIVFPQGDAHVVSSAPGMRGAPHYDAFREVRHRNTPIAVSIRGGAPEQEQLVCGYLGCDARPFNPLLATLPRMMHLRPESADDPLHRLLDLAVAEASEPRAGGDCVLSKLSELLFVEVVRRYVAQLPAEGVGWFAGLRDENIGLALQKLHERPAHDWTLEELAKGAASRGPYWLSASRTWWAFRPSNT